MTGNGERLTRGDAVFTGIGPTRLHRSRGGDGHVAAGELGEPAGAAHAIDVATAAIAVEGCGNGQRSGSLSTGFNRDAAAERACHPSLCVDQRVDGHVAAREHLDVAAFEPAAGVDRSGAGQIPFRFEADLAAAAFRAGAAGRERRRRVDDDVATRR